MQPLEWAERQIVAHNSIVCLLVAQLYGHNELHKHLSTHKTSGLWLLI